MINPELKTFQLYSEEFYSNFEVPLSIILTTIAQSAHQFSEAQKILPNYERLKRELRYIQISSDSLKLKNIDLIKKLNQKYFGVIRSFLSASAKTKDHLNHFIKINFHVIEAIPLFCEQFHELYKKVFVDYVFNLVAGDFLSEEELIFNHLNSSQSIEMELGGYSILFEKRDEKSSIAVILYVVHEDEIIEIKRGSADILYNALKSIYNDALKSISNEF